MNLEYPKKKITSVTTPYPPSPHLLSHSPTDSFRLAPSKNRGPPLLALRLSLFFHIVRYTTHAATILTMRVRAVQHPK